MSDETPNEESFLTCPLCNGQTAKEHCESSTCNWIKCTDPVCDGTIDLPLAIGHCVDPQGMADAKSGLRPRMRVEFKGGEWRERLHG